MWHRHTRCGAFSTDHIRTRRRSHPMSRVLMKALVAAGAVAMGIAGLGGDASAVGGRTTQVDGLLEPDADGSCTDNPASAGTYDVSGSLVGCWSVDTFVVNHESNAAGLVASGNETL